MSETIENAIELAEIRAKRLADIAEGYEIYEEGMPDSTVPGAASPMYGARPERKILRHPRYVLVTQYGDKGNYRLRLGADLRNIEQLAADAVTDVYGGEQPVCYFDLDVLAGDEPLIYEGDKVRYEGNEHTVDHVDEEFSEGEVGRYLCLLDAGHESGSWDDYDHRVHEDDVEVIESEHEDERMPVRYGLARIITQVVFNTVPSP